MKKFFVAITLPEQPDEDFWLRIPAHRILINQLMNEGKIALYTVNFNRTKGWIVMNGNSREEILSLVKTFPIYPFYEDVEVDELFIYDNVSDLPEIVMN